MNLKEINFPSNLTSIGANAFRSSSIQKAILPEGVLTISAGAFSICHGLQEISLPSTLKNVGSQVFYDCPLLKKAHLACPNVGDWLQGKDLLSEFTFGETVKTIADYAFKGCSSLTEVEIPEGVNSLGKWAFEGCTELKNLTISSTVTTMGEKICNGCSLESLVLKCPDVMESAFPEISIDRLSLDGVKRIGTSAFYKTAFDEIEWGQTLEEIGTVAFYQCTGVTDVILPPTFRTLGGGCFGCNNNLFQVKMPDQVTAIPDMAFVSCPNLTWFTIPKKLESIGSGAFENCKSLEEFDIPEGVTTISDDAFRKDNKLKKVSLPSTLTYFGSYVFYECPLLLDIYCFKTNPQITYGTQVFDYPALDNGILRIPEGTAASYTDTFPWKRFKNRQEMVLGDVTGDGVLDNADVYALRYYLFGTKPVELNSTLADVDRNGDINIVDAVLMINKIREAVK